MKTPLFLICAMLLTSQAIAGPKPTEDKPVKVLSTKMNIFYFKVSKDMVGAEIKVFSENGETIISSVAANRKTIVDFYNEEAGNYIIEVTKNGQSERFTFRKKDPSPLIPLEEISTELKTIDISFFKKKKEEKWYC